MSRFRTYTPLDDAPAEEGDRFFVGVNMKLAPDKLPPGYLSLAINKSLRTGTAATRGGLLTPLFHNPAHQPSGGTGAIWGSGLYSDAAGLEHLLLARTNEVWICREGEAPGTLTLPAPLTAACELVQFVNRVRLLRGAGLTPWVWDGSSAGFVEADQSPTGNETIPVPGTVAAEVISDRMAMINGRDEVIFTDILDDNHYDPLLASVRVNAGSRESLVRVFPFYGTNLLAFAEQGVFLLENVTGTLADLRQTEVNRELGLIARRAVSAVGADVFFLSGTGVFRVLQAFQDRIATGATPISDPMEPFFRERIHWLAASGACSAVAGEYYYLAVPIDGAADNNALLVFNTVTNAWEGWHTFPAGVALSALHVTDWQGRKRLFAVDGTAGLVYLLHEGMVDRIGSTVTEISDLARTRGYAFGGTGRVRSARGALDVETWRPRFALRVRSDGVNETTELIPPTTKERTRYYLHNAARYNTSNANDDHGAPYREDYSVAAGTAFQTQSGIVFDRRQATQEPFVVRERGRYFTLELTNTQGRCDLAGVSLEMAATDRNSHTKP